MPENAPDQGPVEPPPAYTAALVFDDPTPNAVILNRIDRFPLEIAVSAPT